MGSLFLVVASTVVYFIIAKAIVNEIYRTPINKDRDWSIIVVAISFGYLYLMDQYIILPSILFGLMKLFYGAVCSVLIYLNIRIVLCTKHKPRICILLLIFYYVTKFSLFTLHGLFK